MLYCTTVKLSKCCFDYQAAAKEAAGQATQLIAAASMASPSNRNQTSQQQLNDQCKVSIKD